MYSKVLTPAMATRSLTEYSNCTSDLGIPNGGCEGVPGLGRETPMAKTHEICFLQKGNASQALVWCVFSKKMFLFPMVKIHESSCPSFLSLYHEKLRYPKLGFMFFEEDCVSQQQSAQNNGAFQDWASDFSDRAFLARTLDSYLPDMQDLAVMSIAASKIFGKIGPHSNLDIWFCPLTNIPDTFSGSRVKTKVPDSFLCVWEYNLESDSCQSQTSEFVTLTTKPLTEQDAGPDSPCGPLALGTWGQFLKRLSNGLTSAGKRRVCKCFLSFLKKAASGFASSRRPKSAKPSGPFASFHSQVNV